MGAFKVRALVVSMGGVQFGADVKLSRGAANRLDLATGDTLYLPAGAGVNASAGSLQVPQIAGSLALSVMNANANGAIYVGQRAGSAQFGFIINGTAIVFSTPITGQGGAPVCTVGPA